MPPLSSPANAVVIVIETIFGPYGTARTDASYALCNFFALSSRAEESTVSSLM